MNILANKIYLRHISEQDTWITASNATIISHIRSLFSADLLAFYVQCTSFLHIFSLSIFDATTITCFVCISNTYSRVAWRRPLLYQKTMHFNSPLIRNKFGMSGFFLSQKKAFGFGSFGKNLQQTSNFRAKRKCVCVFVQLFLDYIEIELLLLLPSASFFVYVCVASYRMSKQHECQKLWSIIMNAIAIAPSFLLSLCHTPCYLSITIHTTSNKHSVGPTRTTTALHWHALIDRFSWIFVMPHLRLNASFSHLAFIIIAFHYRLLSIFNWFSLLLCVHFHKNPLGYELLTVALIESHKNICLCLRLVRGHRSHVCNANLTFSW